MAASRSVTAWRWAPASRPRREPAPDRGQRRRDRVLLGLGRADHAGALPRGRARLPRDCAVRPGSPSAPRIRLLELPRLPAPESAVAGAGGRSGAYPPRRLRAGGESPVPRRRGRVHGPPPAVQVRLQGLALLAPAGGLGDVDAALRPPRARAATLHARDDRGVPSLASPWDGGADVSRRHLC